MAEERDKLGRDKSLAKAESMHSFLGVEFEDDHKPDFQNPVNRTVFTGVVLGVITFQLFLTVICSVVFYAVPQAKNAINNHSWIIFVFVVVLVVPYFMLTCCESTRREFPTNIILLFFLTIGMIGTSACCTAWFDTIVIIYTLILTIFITVTIIILSIISPIHFTSWKWIFGIFFILLLFFSAIVFPLWMATSFTWQTFLYPGIAMAFFGSFLVHDMKQIMGGHRDIHIGPGSFIIGIAQVYADVIGLFITFLEIVGTITEND